MEEIVGMMASLPLRLGEGYIGAAKTDVALAEKAAISNYCPWFSLLFIVYHRLLFGKLKCQVDIPSGILLLG